MNPLNYEIFPLASPWIVQDPFLLCGYLNNKYPAADGKLGVKPAELSGRNIGGDFSKKDGWSMYHGEHIPGFPYHPHRGFETISINKAGVIDHFDSLKGTGRFMGGDVQWMTAGKGIQHSEMFPLLKDDQPNPLEMFQIWINLPKASKLVEPHFKMLWKEDIPVVILKDENGKEVKVDVIAGKFGDKKALSPTPNSWAANSENSVSILTISMDPGAQLTLPKIPDGVSRNVYFYSGTDMKVGDQTVKVMSGIRAKNGDEIILKNGQEKASLLVLEARPIKEPVAQYGPFVMNTEAEIQEAFNDYQKTQFGGWPWEGREKAYEKEQGRFALYSDGTKETK